MRTIEIDFDIHKLIEAERRSFHETPNDALRRLLKLPETTKEASPPKAMNGHFLAWQGEGVVLPHGTKLRMPYGRPKTIYSGEIVNGEWVIEGQRFDSPSGAASGVAITGKGEKTRLNGWVLWEVQKPGEQEWTSLNRLRNKEVTLADLGF